MLLESAVRLISLSFALTLSVPAFVSTEVTLPHKSMLLGFHLRFLLHRVIGVAGFACAKLTQVKAKLETAITKTLIIRFTVHLLLLIYLR